MGFASAPPAGGSAASCLSCRDVRQCTLLPGFILTEGGTLARSCLQPVSAGGPPPGSLQACTGRLLQLGGQGQRETGWPGPSDTLSGRGHQQPPSWDRWDRVGIRVLRRKSTRVLTIPSMLQPKHPAPLSLEPSAGHQGPLYGMPHLSYMLFLPSCCQLAP